MTSDNLTLGCFTLFQSWRVVRPQDASKAHALLSLLSSSACPDLDTNQQLLLRLVAKVADMEARLGLTGRYVDRSFQHNRRPDVGSICDLENAGSVGFVKRLWSTSVSLLSPRRSLIRGSSLTRESTSDILWISFWAVAHVVGYLLC